MGRRYRECIKPIMEGVCSFYDCNGKRIATYDQEVRGSGDDTYARVQLAHQAKRISSGKYLQWLDYLDEAGVVLDTDDSFELAKSRQERDALLRDLKRRIA